MRINVSSICKRLVWRYNFRFFINITYFLKIFLLAYTDTEVLKTGFKINMCGHLWYLSDEDLGLILKRR